jgi:DNA polymerase I-like protein with 3'-5' exonuclease and polymerase domains
MSVQMTGFNDYDLERRRPDYHIVLTGDRFEQMIRFLESSKILVFDTETSGLEWFRESRICGVALAGTVDGQTHHFYTPFRHCTGEAQLDIERVSPDIRKLLAGPQFKIGHHLKFDKHMANREGWVVAAPWYDTMIAAKLYDENRYVALKTRAVEDLGESQAKVGEGRVDEMVHRLAKQQRMGVEAYRAQYGYSQVPIWLLGEYACGDTEFTNRLHIFYEQTHRSISQRYARIWKTEMDLLDVICDMEEQGIAIDVEYLSKLRLRLQLELQRVEAEITVLLGGRKLELGSDAVIRKLLLEDLGCRLHKMTRGGAKGTAKQFAVDKEVLAEFAHVHPAIERILAWREAEKLANTYTLSILDRLDSRNYLHPDFQQMGTTSGRLSCKSPNFQNQPVDDDDRAKKHSGKSLEEGGTDPWSIRRSYVVGRPGWVRLFFDYSQIELRVLAYYTKDPILVAAYMNGEDIHTRTSIEVFGTAEKAMRRLAKVINFGLCISEGQRVLTQQDGLVPIERVQDHHLLWDGVEWVKHDGLVCRGVEEVLTYDGITATPDHVVYLRDGGAATLRDAASAIYSRRLAVGAIGETPVRFVSVDRAGGKDSSGRWEAASGGGVAVRELRGDQMVFGRQCSRWSFFLRLSEGEIPRQARRYFGWALRCYGAALRAGYARFLEELQGAGDQGSVQVTGAFCPVGFEEVSRIGFPGIGLRSHRQRWGLLSRKSATGDSFGEFAQSQQAKVYDLINAGPRHRFTVEGRVVSNSYGLSPVGFARQVHVSREEAESYFNKFFERYHGIVDFRDTFWAQVRRQKGYFQNLFGRPRRVQGMNISDNFERGKAEREAIASLIQGTAAELTKESLVRIAHYLKDRALPAKLISTVHDEIQLDCAAEVLPEVAIAVKRLMEDYSEFSPIPIRVDGDYTVRSWSDKTKLPKA